MKILKKLLAICVVFAVAAFSFSVSAQAAQPKKGDVILGQNVGVKDLVIGVYDAKGRIVYQPVTSDLNGKPKDKINANALNELLNNDKKKTLVIPSGSKVEVSYVIRIGDNTTIIADDATIIQTTNGKGLISNDVHSADYKSLQHVRIQGGTWKNKSNKSGCTMMRFAMGSDITVYNAKVVTNYKGHALEFIACKDVLVKKCTLKAQGETYKKSVEEALQIDIATPVTAPGIKSEGAGKYLKGQTCKSVTVVDNTISGSRGVCANYASKESKYKNKFHDNIVIKNNKLTGKSAEACALFNTLNATVTGNTITTNSTRTNESYSVGLNIAIMGKAPSSISKAKVVVKKNTIKGGRQGLNIITKTSSKYGQVTVSDNKLYSSKGKDSAMHISEKAVKKLTKTNNKLYKWKK